MQRRLDELKRQQAALAAGGVPTTASAQGGTGGGGGERVAKRPKPDKPPPGIGAALAQIPCDRSPLMVRRLRAVVHQPVARFDVRLRPPAFTSPRPPSPPAPPRQTLKEVCDKCRFAPPQYEEARGQDGRYTTTVLLPDVSPCCKLQRGGCPCSMSGSDLLMRPSRDLLTAARPLGCACQAGLPRTSGAPCDDRKQAKFLAAEAAVSELRRRHPSVD